MKEHTAHGNVVKVAVGYVRVSTLEQASEGVSLGAQRDKIHVYCKFNGIKLIDITALHTAGLGFADIARQLTAEGICARRGGPW